MSATAVATVITTRASGRPPRPPMIEPIIYAPRSTFQAATRLALRAMAYTTAAVVGFGGVPAAMALLDDAGVFSGIFAL